MKFDIPFERYSMLHKSQMGFRQLMGTEDAIFSLVGALRYRRHRKHESMAAFVDMRKAYDMVGHDTLLSKLMAMGAGDDFIHQQRMSFNNLTARVWLNGQLSESFSITRGVPQGDPLSPLLFSLFLDDLLQELAASSVFEGVEMEGRSAAVRRIKALAYADDIVLLASTADSLQAGLNIVSRWAVRWGMEINTSKGKTEIMVFPAVVGGDAAEAADKQATTSRKAAKIARSTAVRAEDAAATAAEQARAAAYAAENSLAATADIYDADASHIAQVIAAEAIGKSPQQLASEKSTRAAAASEAASSTALAATAAAVAAEAAADAAELAAAGAAGRRFTVEVAGGKEVNVGIVRKYDYLGILITPDLNMAAAMRSRLAAAELHAHEWRSLPTGVGGLPISLLSSTHMGIVTPHMEYGAAVWGPPWVPDTPFGSFTSPHRAEVRGMDTHPHERGVSLQLDGACGTLGLSGPGMEGEDYAARALLLSELGWTHLPTRWNLATLRMLGKILRSPADSYIRVVANSLLTIHNTVVAEKGVAAASKILQWNWVTTALSIVDTCDAVVPAELRLGQRFSVKKLQPCRNGSSAVVLRSEVQEFDGKWRRWCHAALISEEGRDSIMWRQYLEGRRAEYTHAHGTVNRDGHVVRTIPSVRDPGEPQHAAEAAVAGGGIGPQQRIPVSQRGPVTCGTTSTMMHLASLTSATPSMQHAFGKQKMEPYLRYKKYDKPMYARICMRIGVRRGTWRRDNSPSAAAAATDAEGANGIPHPVRLAGGYLWGETECSLCDVMLPGDVFHRVAECTRLDADRLAAFDHAIARVEKWGANRADNGAPQLAAVKEAREHRHTLAGRTFVFLATLGGSMQAGAVDGMSSGMPEAWSNLFYVPLGSGAEQRNTVAMAAVFRGFAKFAVLANTKVGPPQAEHAAVGDISL